MIAIFTEEGSDHVERILHEAEEYPEELIEKADLLVESVPEPPVTEDGEGQALFIVKGKLVWRKGDTELDERGRTKVVPTKVSMKRKLRESILEAKDVDELRAAMLDVLEAVDK